MRPTGRVPIPDALAPVATGDPVVELGRIVGRHGIRGEVRFLPHNPDSDLFAALTHVLLERDGCVERRRLLSVRPHKRVWLARIEGVDGLIGPEPLTITVCDNGTFEDLIFNPFPARVTIRVPGDVLASEGFRKSGKSGDLVIEPIDLFAAIGELEGKWISPDPLVALLRDERPAPEDVAKLPRKSEAVVSGGEVARAIRDQLQRPRTYSVRWRS
jgi:hypothetical protein